MDYFHLLQFPEVDKVSQVQFGLLGPELIKNMSVVEVTTYQRYSSSGEPIRNGLNDPRMGPSDRDRTCETCSQDSTICPGHFGHIELAVPVLHVSFMKQVEKILNSVCPHCRRLKISYSDPEMYEYLLSMNPEQRFRAVTDKCSSQKQCPSSTSGPQIIKDIRLAKILFGDASPSFDKLTGEPYWERDQRKGCDGLTQPLFRRNGFELFYKSDRTATTSREEPAEMRNVVELLRSISEPDIRLLGLSPEFSRPLWMVIQALPVPPPCVRPSVMNDSGQRSEDDLTFQLTNIIKINDQLREEVLSGTSNEIRISHGNLTINVAQLFSNETPFINTALHKSGRPLKSLTMRIKGKEGRVRGNLMGKRVEFSARTVITGDPNLRSDEIGVPRSIAMKLTVPERVTPINRSHLQDLVGMGASELEGANYVIDTDGVRTDLRYAIDPPTLHSGDIVERHLTDGDYVVFNRQPSLHKMSMMGHRVRILPYSSFRINLSVTTPYNADFDGDEMNLHVPQDLGSISEVRGIMLSTFQMITPQSNSPIIGAVMDTLLASRKLSHKDTFLTRDEMMNMIMWMDQDSQVDNRQGFIYKDLPRPAIFKPQELWTGKQMFSMLMPRINLQLGTEGVRSSEKPGSSFPKYDTGVLIRNGELIHGILSKSAVSKASGGILHVICNDYSFERARRFLDHCQKVINQWFISKAYSIGVSDTIATPDTLNEISLRIDKSYKAVFNTIVDARQDKLEKRPGMGPRETFEFEVNKELNEAGEAAGNITKASLQEEDNNIVFMVKAGSKGNIINISQIIACVGQQNVNGRRIGFGYSMRTLPHFGKHDIGPEARGFVRNSYLRGLTPSEFYFHAMGGREGLVDTAVKTADTGYIQRKLVKAMEDVTVCYDGTVRNSARSVVQFIYGDDGLDALRIEKQRLDFIGFDHEEMRRRFVFDTQPTSKDAEYLPDEILEDLRSNRKIQNLLLREFDEIVSIREEIIRNGLIRDLDKEACRFEVFLPVNLYRLISNAQAEQDQTRRRDLHPQTVILKVDKLLRRIEDFVIQGDDDISRESKSNALFLFRAHVRSTLGSKRVLIEHKINRAGFKFLLKNIYTEFVKSVVSPGEMVGVVAAQSLGEPATQMTLNTFHYAGVSSKNVTLGVPRLKEIIDASKNMKTPSMTIFLETFDNELMERVKAEMEFLDLRGIVARAEIAYDANNNVYPKDTDFVRRAMAVSSSKETETLSSWLIRLVLDKSLIAYKKLSLEDLALKLEDSCAEERIGLVNIIHSDANANELVLRIRRVITLDSPEDDFATQQLTLNSMLRIRLAGIPGVTRVVSEERDKTIIYDRETGTFKRKREYALLSDGTKLLETLAIDGVDSARSFSNDVIEINERFGIEAARETILREMYAIVSFGGSYVNQRHMTVLADVMTRQGELLPFSRRGIIKGDAGPITKASFEQTVDTLSTAAIFAKKDYLLGVSDNILLGNQSHFGTGNTDIVLNEVMLRDAIPQDDNVMEPISVGGFDTGELIFEGEREAGIGIRSPNERFVSPSENDVIISPIGGGKGGMDAPFFQTPDDLSYEPRFTPTGMDHSLGANYSPMSPGGPGGMAIYSPASPGGMYSPASPGGATYSPMSPGGPGGMYSPASPGGATFSPASPGGATYSPASPGGATYSPASPGGATYSPASPGGFGIINASPGMPGGSRFAPSTGTSYQLSASSIDLSGGLGSGVFGVGNETFAPSSPRFSRPNMDEDEADDDYMV